MTLENQPLTRSASEFAAPPRIRFTQSECCALEIIQTVQPGEKAPIDMIRKAVGSGEPGEDGQVSSPQQVGIIFASLNSKLENKGWVFKPYYKKQDGKKHQVVGGYSAKWSGDGDQTMAPQRLAGLIGANRLWHERIQQPQVTLFSLDSGGVEVTGLTPRQQQLLILLANQEGEPVSRESLGASLGLKPQTVSNHIDTISAILPPGLKITGRGRQNNNGGYSLVVDKSVGQEEEKKRIRPVTEILPRNLDENTVLHFSQIIVSFLAAGCLSELGKDPAAILKNCLPELENSPSVFENLKAEERGRLERYLVGLIIRRTIDNWEEDPGINSLGYPERRRNISQLCKNIREGKDEEGKERPQAKLATVIRVICSHFSITTPPRYQGGTVSDEEEARLFNWGVPHRGGY